MMAYKFQGLLCLQDAYLVYYLTSVQFRKRKLWRYQGQSLISLTQLKLIHSCLATNVNCLELPNLYCIQWKGHVFQTALYDLKMRMYNVELFFHCGQLPVTYCFVFLIHSIDRVLEQIKSS